MSTSSHQPSPFSFMTPSDLPEVVALEGAAFAVPWTQKAFVEELENPISRVLLLRLPNRKLVGFAVYWLVADEIQILHVAVSPPHRKQGHGSTLMNHILDYGHDHHFNIATLEYRASNEAAAKLYESFGFNVVAVRREYYKDNKEDAILMELKLGDAKAV